MQKFKYMMIIGLMVGLASCASTPYVIVRPNNFAAVQNKFDTFLFGSFYTDTGQDVFLSFNSDDLHVLLSRIDYYNPTPEKAEFFIFPMTNKVYPIRSIEFSSDPERYEGDAFYNYYNNLRSHSGSMIIGGTNVNYPTRIFPYPLSLNVEKGKINYIGRIIMTNDSFLVENHFDEDKDLLFANFQSDTNAVIALSHAVFTNLKQ